MLTSFSKMNKKHQTNNIHKNWIKDPSNKTQKTKKPSLVDIIQ